MPPEVLKESRLTAATHTPWTQAPLDRHAVVQAQHHARRERIAGAVAALDFAGRDPHRGLPPGLARPPRRRRSRRGSGPRQGRAHPAAAARARPSSGSSCPVTAAASSSLMMMVSRCGRHGSASSRIRAGSTQTSSRLVRMPGCPGARQDLREAVAAGRRPVHPLVHARRADVEDPGRGGGEVELLRSRAAHSRPGSGRRCAGRCRARSSRRCRPCGTPGMMPTPAVPMPSRAQMSSTSRPCSVVADQAHHLHREAAAEPGEIDRHVEAGAARSRASPTRSSRRARPAAAGRSPC